MQILCFYEVENSSCNKNILALESFTTAIQVDPKHVPSLLCRGNIYRALGKYSKARKDFKSCLEIDENMRMSLFGIACCDFAEKRFESALNSLNHLISRNPNFVKAIFLRAEVYRKLKQYQHSLNDFDTLVECFSKLQHDQLNLSGGIRKAMGGIYARRALVAYHINKDLDGILEDFSNALSLNPGDIFVFNSLGLIFYETNNLEKAEYYLDECLKRNPNDIDALITYGRLMKTTKRYEEASAAFRRVISISGKSLVVYYHLMGLYLETGSHRLALDTIDAIMRIRSDERLKPVRDSLLKLVKASDISS